MKPAGRLSLLPAVVFGLLCTSALPQAERVTAAMGDAAEVTLGIGGCGGVYFLASPGELVVEVEKRDRHLSDRDTELRAILVGPDREVLQEAAIPDDGQPKGSGLGAPQRVALRTQVRWPGVYALNVTVSQDRYGDEISWGFRTNCPKYLVETSRGHRDARHEEPLVLLNPDRPGDVCFLPRQGEFGMEVTGLPADVTELSVYDAAGALVATLPVAEGKVSYTVPADEHRDAVPWRLHLPRFQGTVQIDGVTRWDPGDLYPNLSLWTPDLASWFPFEEHRWLLTPYSRMVYARPGDEAKVTLQVHNNLTRDATVKLQVEYPEAAWPVRLAAEEVTVPGRRAAPVEVTCTAPVEGETRVCHIRATPTDDAGFSTYSTVRVIGGEAPAARPLEMPIMLKPYRHENAQFGYLPQYPLGNQLYFDLQDRPFVSLGRSLATMRDGKWVTLELGGGYSAATSKVAFDRDNDVYVLASGGGTVALLHSVDGGATFTPYPIPPNPAGGSAFDIEQFSGNNIPDGPPPFVRFTRTFKDPKLFWRSLSDLELFVPTKADGKITVGEPILISKLCIGLAAHSGTPSSVVSRGTKVHVAWGEATDPEVKVPGLPAYVATYDRETGQLSTPALIGYGAPPNDIHNSPSITMDGQGYLHVLGGTHGQPFPYARSLQPNDAGSGWTEPAILGEGLSQTYIGSVCGPDGTLHLAYRLWRTGEPYPHSSYATLAYQRKRPGQPWEAPRVLIVAPFSEYSVFYHRLTIDHKGRLFLSYDYWSTYWFYRNDHFGDRRAVLMSPDGGDTWKLAGDEDVG
ncbi:MAG: hypothetical protein FJX75_08675 [Armatimonadetes bacterium]|nr:hypothetical protein [Armatimonadota bacterium]